MEFLEHLKQFFHAEPSHLLAGLEARISALESRAAAPFAALEARLSALEGRLAQMDTLKKEVADTTTGVTVTAQKETTS